MNLLKKLRGNISFISYIALSTILGLTLILLLFLSLTVEKRSLQAIAELTGQRVSIYIHDGKIVSRAPLNQEIEDQLKYQKLEVITDIEKVVEIERSPVKENTERLEVLEERVSQDRALEEVTSQNTANVEAEPLKETVRESYKVETDKPAIAIVVGGVGLTKSSMGRVLELPPIITLGLSPYAPNLNNFAKKIKSSRYDVLINLPLEPIHYPNDDPGPYAMISELTDEENFMRLEQVLSQFQGIKGVYSIENENFTRSITGTRVLLNTLKKKRLLFLYEFSNKYSSIKTMKNYLNSVVIFNNVIIDDDVSPSGIMRGLEQLEYLAKKKGYAVGFARSYPNTIKALNEWLEELEEKNIQVLPISELQDLIKLRKNVSKNKQK
jgi:polysaccharide deacetylase 2 family uncharacterized protein YibQ